MTDTPGPDPIRAGGGGALRSATRPDHPIEHNPSMTGTRRLRSRCHGPARTDPKGQVRQYTYDDAGRRVGEAHYLNASDAAANANAVKTITYGYNDLDRLARWTDTSAGGSATAGTLAYDPKQLRKMGESVHYGTFSLSYSYDYYQNGQKRSFTGPDGVTITYTYDANNQLAQVQLPIGSLTVNSYRWTAPSQLTFPGGTTRTQGYDPLLRLKTIAVKDPLQNEVLAYGYSYNKADNITAKTTEHGTYSYAYDRLYRLTQAHNPSPPGKRGLHLRRRGQPPHRQRRPRGLDV